jgi:hypothetical protein
MMKVKQQHGCHVGELFRHIYDHHKNHNKQKISMLYYIINDLWNLEDVDIYSPLKSILSKSTPYIKTKMLVDQLLLGGEEETKMLIKFFVELWIMIQVHRLFNINMKGCDLIEMDIFEIPWRYTVIDKENWDDWMLLDIVVELFPEDKINNQIYECEDDTMVGYFLLPVLLEYCNDKIQNNNDRSKISYRTLILLYNYMWNQTNIKGRKNLVQNLDSTVEWCRDGNEPDHAHHMIMNSLELVFYLMEKGIIPYDKAILQGPVKEILHNRKENTQQKFVRLCQFDHSIYVVTAEDPVFLHLNFFENETSVLGYLDDCQKFCTDAQPDFKLDELSRLYEYVYENMLKINSIKFLLEWIRLRCIDSIFDKDQWLDQIYCGSHVNVSQYNNCINQWYNDINTGNSYISSPRTRLIEYILFHMGFPPLTINGYEWMVEWNFKIHVEIEKYKYGHELSAKQINRITKIYNNSVHKSVPSYINRSGKIKLVKKDIRMRNETTKYYQWIIENIVDLKKETVIDYYTNYQTTCGKWDKHFSTIQKFLCYRLGLNIK